jgi:hypothetical protein
MKKSTQHVCSHVLLTFWAAVNLHAEILVSGVGKCLDVHSPDKNKNGGKVQVWDCVQAAQQRWTLRNGQLISDVGKCLDVDSSEQNRNGAKVQVWDCNQSIQQRWTVKDGQLISGFGKCLDVHFPDQYRNGAKVQVWDCNQSIQQWWQLTGIQPEPFYLFVESEPAGVEVEVGIQGLDGVATPGTGRIVGKTPLKVELKPSDVTFNGRSLAGVTTHLRKEGFVPIWDNWGFDLGKFPGKTHTIRVRMKRIGQPR